MSGYSAAGAPGVPGAPGLNLVSSVAGRIGDIALTIADIAGGYAAADAAAALALKLDIAAAKTGYVSALGIYQPEKYGAVGDNATANKPFIDSAIADATAAGGGKVVFGVGIFRTLGSHLVNTDNVTFYGVPGATHIRTTHAANPVIDFGDNVTLRSFLGVKDIVLDTALARTGGAFIRARKTAVLDIERCRLDGAYYGIDLLDTQITRLTDLHIINNVAAVGEGIRADSTGTGTNLYITRCSSDAPAGAQPRAGLRVARWDGIFLTDTQFNHSGYGAIFEPPAAQNLDHIFAVNCSFDTNANTGVLFNAGGGVVRRAWFLGCWFGSNTVNGVVIAGGAQGISFIQPKVFANGQHGMLLNDCTDVEIIGPQISGNSYLNSGVYDGISVAAGVSRWKILGGAIRPFSGFPNSQNRAITVAAGAGDYISVIDVDCDGNLDAVNGIYIGGVTGTHNVFRNNRGFVTESKGTANQPAANGAIVVNHGLAVTPSAADITITPQGDLGAVSKFYVSNVGAVSFQINTAGAPGVIVPWAWRAQVYQQ